MDDDGQKPGVPQGAVVPDEKKPLPPHEPVTLIEKKPVTLTDADISSNRFVSRRSLLGTLGIGAGVAAAAVLGSVTPALADRAKTTGYRDRDPSDGAKVRAYRDRDPISSDRAKRTNYRDRDTGDRAKVTRYRDND
jgi:hypothetical protein